MSGFRGFVAALCAGFTVAILVAPSSGAVEGSAFVAETRSPTGIVVSDQVLASAAGRDILRADGNALDAAAAAIFALGVVQPAECGLGGGVRVLYRPAKGETIVVDGGGRAPAAATPTTIGSTPGGIDAEGLGHRVVGVPGEVAGLAEALRTHGTITLAEAVAPAERLAREGFAMTGDLFGQVAFGGGQELLSRFPEAASIYLHPDGSPYTPGEVLQQPDLAWTFRQIAAHGAAAFYTGEVASRIAAEMAKPPGAPGDEAILTASDLARYAPVRRAPLRSNYRGATILTVPPPMAGVSVIEMLNLLEGFKLSRMGAGSAEALHVWAEVQKIADADIDAVLTDPAFYPVPTDRLTSQGFANQRRRLIDPATAQTYEPGVTSGHGHGHGRNRDDATIGHTAHVSAIDSAGNAAAVTCTLGGAWGSGIVVEDTGVLLGNGLRSPDPAGHPDQIEGDKMRATAIAPTIVVKGNVPVLVLGAGGNAAIYRDVVGIISNVLDFGMDIGHAVDAERYHAYQDEAGPYVFAEDARIAPDVLEDLDDRGHVIAWAFGEYACCPPLLGIAAAAGIDRRTGERVGAGDVRRLGEDLAAGQ